MEKITIFYAQKLIDELLDSSSSSNEDDEIFTVINSKNHERQTKNSNFIKDTGALNAVQQQQQVDKFNHINDLNERNQQPPNENIKGSQDSKVIILPENASKSSKYPCRFKKKQPQTKSFKCEHNLTNTISKCQECENQGEANKSICTNEINQEQNFANCSNINENTNLLNLQKNTPNSNASPCRMEEMQQDRVKSFEFEDKLMNIISDSEFKENFNVRRETAIYLMEKYSLWHFQSSYQESAAKATVESNILSFLWFCSNETNFSDLVQLFNTTFSDIRKTFKSVLKFLIDELASEVIKFPSTYPEKEELAKEFEKVAGFPKVVGCVAESYFPVKTKLVQKCGGSYVYLRAICDAKLRFLNVKTGVPRQVSDYFMEKDLPKLCSPTYHLLGDSKCPIREHLMIPFDLNANLSDSEKYFNIKLIRTHVKIKNAFGILKSRFRQLKCLEFSTVETLTEFIVGCCVLHNICIDREDHHKEEIYTDVSDRLYNSSLAAIDSDEFLSDLGLMKRYELKQILFKSKT